MRHFKKLFLALMATTCLPAMAVDQDPTYDNYDYYEVDELYYSFYSYSDSDMKDGRNEATLECKCKQYRKELNNNQWEETFVYVSAEYSGELVIPEHVTFDGVEYTVTCIGNGAFSECYNLTSIVIPSTVTDLGNMFSHTETLLHDGLYTRTNVKRITFLNPVPATCSKTRYYGNAFEGLADDAVLVVPNDSKEAYEADEHYNQRRIVEQSEIHEPTLSITINNKAVDNGQTVHIHNCFPGKVKNGELLFDASCLIRILGAERGDLLVVDAASEDSYTPVKVELRSDDNIATSNMTSCQLSLAYKDYWPTLTEIRTCGGSVSLQQEGHCSVIVRVYPADDPLNYVYFTLVFDRPNSEIESPYNGAQRTNTAGYNESNDNFYTYGDKQEITMLEDDKDYYWNNGGYTYPSTRWICVKSCEVGVYRGEFTTWCYDVKELVLGPRGDANGDGQVNVGDIEKIQQQILETK